MLAKEERKPTGPTPKRLKIEGDWEEAVKKSFTKPPLRKPVRKSKKK